MKTRENAAVLEFLAVDNFDFTRKIVKKNLSQKLVKMLGFCQNRIFGQKLDFWYSVRQYIGKKISLAILNVLQSLFER